MTTIIYRIAYFRPTQSDFISERFHLSQIDFIRRRRISSAKGRFLLPKADFSRESGFNFRGTRIYAGYSHKRRYSRLRFTSELDTLCAEYANQRACVASTCTDIGASPTKQKTESQGLGPSTRRSRISSRRDFIYHR